MSIGTFSLIVLVLILLGVLPVWPHARRWGYGPSGIVCVVILIVLVLMAACSPSSSAIAMTICGTRQREGCGDVPTLS
jgi:hypothetical protein